MRCRDVHRLSDRLAAGRLTDAEQVSVERHAAACRACRELVLLCGTDDEGPAHDVDLLPAVVAYTGGDPCAAARRRMCARVDDELDELDTELVDGHRAACEACEGFAATLATLRDELPTLAEVDPGPAFTQQVLAACGPRVILTPTLVDRLVNWMTERGRLWQRPRLALEAAYVATLLLTLLVVTPGSPLADVPNLALMLTRSRPTLDLRSPAARLELGLRESARSLWKRTAEPLDDATREIAGDTARASGVFTDRIRQHVGTFAARLASNTTTTEGAEPAPESQGDEP